MSSVFESVAPGAPIEIFQLSQRFRNDTFDKKVDLGVGGMYQWLICVLT